MDNNLFENLDRSKIKYALYARKSNTDENRQTHSTDDQIRLCLEYAEKLGVTIAKKDIIVENTSARYSGNRPLFTKLLQEVKSGKYGGIIAYHPDRLARNMLEAGMIMDMLKPAKNKKEAVLKDLLFPTTPFHNDSSGALTLAFHFAMATNYSDHLQEVVSRGVNSHFQKGKSSGAHKWGYIRNPASGYYEPNMGTGDNFYVIKKCFEMAKEGKSQADIVRYAEEQNIHYKTKAKEKSPSKKVRLASSSSISRVLRDPFYYGILQQAGGEVDLRELPEAGFVPMLKEEEWESVQEILDDSYKAIHRTKVRTKKASDFYYPFKGLIHCKSCGNLLSPFSSCGHNKKGQRWVYYACKNKNCPQRCVRGRVIMEQICQFADELILSDEAYNAYSEAVDKYLNEDLANLKKERAALIGTRTATEKKQKEESNALKVLMTGNAPQASIDATAAQIEAYQDTIDSLNLQIKDKDEQLKNPEQIKVSKDKFLKLVQTAAQQIKGGSFAEKDKMVRKLFSNLLLDEKNKLSISVKPEFEGLIVPKVHQMVE